jgi:hypothetical protein
LKIIFIYQFVIRKLLRRFFFKRFMQVSGKFTIDEHMVTFGVIVLRLMDDFIHIVWRIQFVKFFSIYQVFCNIKWPKSLQFRRFATKNRIKWTFGRDEGPRNLTIMGTITRNSYYALRNLCPIMGGASRNRSPITVTYYEKKERYYVKQDFKRKLRLKYS